MPQVHAAFFGVNLGKQHLYSASETQVDFPHAHGLRRFQESRQSHFITFSCYHRLPKLNNPTACDRFLQTLEAMRVRFSMCVYGFVVMPEHVHLLLSEPEDGLLSNMNIRNHQQFVEKLRYIHRNPVNRGLCKSPADWKWSSFQHYALREKSVVEVESEWAARDREDAKLGPITRPRVFLVPG